MRGRVVGHRSIVNYPSQSCFNHGIHGSRAAVRLLSSTSLSSNSDESRAIESLESYLSHLTTKGRISSEEARSIRGALSNSATDDATKSIIKTSIDAYITMNKRKMESGQAIGSPGLYVRSILRRKLFDNSDNDIDPPSSVPPQNGQQQDSSGQKPKNDSAVQSILQINGISPDELNSSCLLALSQCSEQVADDALKAYTRQKQRRETNGMDKISNPSSYVMAVLRNIMNERPVPSSSPKRESADSEAKISPSSISEKVPGKLMQNEGSAKSNITTETTKPEYQIPPVQRTDQPQDHKTLGSQVTEERKNKADVKVERVTMEYVDQCLSCLAKLEQPIISIQGIGPKAESSFHKLGIFTLRDLLWHFPRSFIDRSKLSKNIRDISDGDVGTFRLKVHADKARHNSVPCTDEAGNNVHVSFFYGRSSQGTVMVNTAMKKLCKKDEDSMIVSGKVKHSGEKAELFNPDVVISSDQADSLGIEAVYSLSAGLTQKKMVAAVNEALSVAGDLLGLLPESLSDDALSAVQWPKLADALVIAHKPTSMTEAGLTSPARQRVAFEELTMQQAQLALSRWKLKHFGVSSELQSKGICNDWRKSPLVSAAVSSLPFKLTQSQMECLDEMWDDAIANPTRMYRLLNGDVSSGKTVVGYLLGLGCVEARQGGQVVSLLCPTQLLAMQHVRSLSDFAARLKEKCNWDIHIELLTGNVVGKSRDELLARLDKVNDNQVIFLIGTHALTTSAITDRLKQIPLALAIVDEEQRFGVRQRHAFTSCATHSLFMSGTPIPRSLSLTKSGLMDLSLLESEPRLVETTIVSLDNLDKVLTVLGSKVDAGAKCFWVLPRIGSSNNENDVDDSTSNVIDRYNILVNTLGNERVCLVHGRMTQQEREDQLANFADPSSPTVLVGTTVIEVGIDIPDANILIVEEADRFGLSQLHQLRGRIGRAGSRPGLKCHCLLISSDNGVNIGDDSRLSRLQILQRSNKGDQIAEADLMLRGPGDMLGYSQSGINSGFSVHPEYHWELLGAATIFGLSFLQQPGQGGVPKEESMRSSFANDTLAQLLAEGKVTEFYNHTSASSSQGLALRMMMALFGDWKSQESTTLEAIKALQSLDAAQGELSQDDKLVEAKIEASCENFTNLQIPDPIALESPDRPEVHLSPIKPHVSALNPQVPGRRKLNLLGDDIVFFVLDVETTGLDDETCHIIQLAAKVLGSEHESDLFSEYILPPIDRIPKKIEELTGITDEFLRNGGYDPALGKERATAEGFQQVYPDFEKFCTKKAKGRKIVFVAHNAKFDMRMLNGELRRWRFSEHEESVPVLGDIFSCSVDTLNLFKQRRWWGSNFGRGISLPRPSSFSLSELHSHVFNEPIANSHNAVGDIKALERLLLSKQFEGWENTANEIQMPFIKVDK